MIRSEGRSLLLLTELIRDTPTYSHQYQTVPSRLAFPVNFGAEESPALVSEKCLLFSLFPMPAELADGLGLEDAHLLFSLEIRPGIVLVPPLCAFGLAPIRLTGFINPKLP